MSTSEWSAYLVEPPAQMQPRSEPLLVVAAQYRALIVSWPSRPCGHASHDSSVSSMGSSVVVIGLTSVVGMFLAPVAPPMLCPTTPGTETTHT